MRAAMIRPIKIAGVAETGNMNCQSSLALRLVHTTLTRKAIGKELRVNWTPFVGPRDVGFEV